MEITPLSESEVPIQIVNASGDLLLRLNIEGVLELPRPQEAEEVAKTFTQFVYKKWQETLNAADQDVIDSVRALKDADALSLRERLNHLRNVLRGLDELVAEGERSDAPGRHSVAVEAIELAEIAISRVEP